MEPSVGTDVARECRWRFPVVVFLKLRECGGEGAGTDPVREGFGFELLFVGRFESSSICRWGKPYPKLGLHLDHPRGVLSALGVKRLYKEWSLGDPSSGRSFTSVGQNIVFGLLGVV